MYERRRNLVRRADGRPVNVARFRGQLFVCATGCCCGRTDDGFAPVPTELYHDEWERRRLRNLVHLTVGGCLGPCALANVVLLLFDGRALWFHSINSEALVVDLYELIERLLEAEGEVPVPASLALCQFTASVWQSRPDGQPVDDYRPRRRITAPGASVPMPRVAPANEGMGAAPAMAEEHRARCVADLAQITDVPRRNGELVFEAPWQGRIFGMAVALSEQGVFAWDEFRAALVRKIADAEARRDEFRYYQSWLAAFEDVLAARGLLSVADIEEAAFQFEFGER